MNYCILQIQNGDFNSQFDGVAWIFPPGVFLKSCGSWGNESMTEA